MKFSIVWSDKSLNHLNAVYDFIAAESPQAASKIIFIILNHVQVLSSFPELGKKDVSISDSKKSCRFLIKGNYKIIYRVINERKVILINAVFDTRQNPKKLKHHLK